MGSVQIGREANKHCFPTESSSKTTGNLSMRTGKRKQKQQNHTAVQSHCQEKRVPELTMLAAVQRTSLPAGLLGCLPKYQAVRITPISSSFTPFTHYLRSIQQLARHAFGSMVWAPN